MSICIAADWFIDFFLCAAFLGESAPALKTPGALRARQFAGLFPFGPQSTNCVCFSIHRNTVEPSDR